MNRLPVIKEKKNHFWAVSSSLLALTAVLTLSLCSCRSPYGMTACGCGVCASCSPCVPCAAAVPGACAPAPKACETFHRKSSKFWKVTPVTSCAPCQSAPVCAPCQQAPACMGPVPCQPTPAPGLNGRACAPTKLPVSAAPQRLEDPQMADPQIPAVNTAPQKKPASPSAQPKPAAEQSMAPEEAKTPKEVKVPEKAVSAPSEPEKEDLWLEGTNDQGSSMMVPQVPNSAGVRVLEAPTPAAAPETLAEPVAPTAPETPAEPVAPAAPETPAEPEIIDLPSIPDVPVQELPKAAGKESEPENGLELPGMLDSNEGELLPLETPELPDSLDSTRNSRPTAPVSPLLKQRALKKAESPKPSAAATSMRTLPVRRNSSLREALLSTAPAISASERPAGKNISIEAIQHAVSANAAGSANVSTASFAAAVLPARESAIRLTAAEEPVTTAPAALPAPAEAPETVVPDLSERPSYAQPADEYVIDSTQSARKRQLKNQQKTKVSGTEIEPNWEADVDDQTGTFIYFNNAQGRATIQSPDPVFIYAPRFRSVRQVVDLNVDEQVLSTGDLYSPQEVSTQGRNTGTDTTKQNAQVGTEAGRAVMLQSQTSAGTGQLDGEIAPQAETQEAVIAQENRKIVGPNAMDGKTRVWTAGGLVMVNAWTKTDELQVFIDQQSASAGVRIQAAPSLYSVKEGDHKQDVRISKVASKTSAKPGETVDFIIYFENVGRTPVGNVVLVDNLPTRLEIVEDSAESSVDASFSYEMNGNGSQTLRWEVTQPLYAGEKGAVKFRALVR